MSGENEPIAKAEANPQGGSAYERSTIAFPYFDLPECLKLAGAISEHVGRNECSDDQLAPWINLSPKSSGYRGRVSAARLFGLIEAGQEKQYRLTDLGLRTLDASHVRGAKIEAFLNVPLFQSVYENWRGQQLPPPAALERAMESFGVARKQTARARQVLERSARDAGFFEQGQDRLVQPGIKDTLADEPKAPVPPIGGGGGSGGSKGGGGGSDQSRHPFVRGLLETLPEPGGDWPTHERVKWLRTAANIFDLIYEGEGGEINVSAKTNGEQ